MKKIRIPHPKKPRTFNEKFGRDVAFFGSREKHTPPSCGKWPFVSLCALGGIVFVVAVILLGGVWKVSEVTAEDGEYYTAASICEFAAIAPGSEMLGFDVRTVRARLRKSLPLLDDIRVRRHLDGTVSITVTEEENLYYTQHNLNYYILSADTHEVLGVYAQPDEAKRVGATYIGLPECTRVRVGEKLTFINLPYAPDSAPQEWTTYEVETDEPEQENAYVFDFIRQLTTSSVSDRIVGMELSDRYDLHVILDGRIRIQIGNMNELDRKLALAARVLADKKDPVPADMVALVDVSDPARVIYRISPDISLPDWAS